MTRKPSDLALPLPPAEGVHLSMPEREYFAAPALGSSDIRILSSDVASWWYSSPWNPERRARVKRANALNFGSALHALVLEGPAAYQARFTCEPDSGSDDWLMNVVQIRDALEAKGVNVGHEYKPEKLYPLARKAGIAHRIYDLAFRSYESAKRAGAQHISRDEDRRVRRMADLLNAHADLGPFFRGGLSEVTVFWRRPEDPDALLRARFDKLHPGKVADLKSMSNPRGKTPEQASLDAIEHEQYDLQFAHYADGLRHALDFIRAGQVFAWSGNGVGARLSAEEKAFLDRVAAVPFESWVWVWAFFQVQDDTAGKERAPVIVPWFEPFNGELYALARPAVDRALEAFRTYRTERGMSEGWSEIRPVTQLPVDRLFHLKRTRAQ